MQEAPIQEAPFARESVGKHGVLETHDREGNAIALPNGHYTLRHTINELRAAMFTQVQ